DVAWERAATAGTVFATHNRALAMVRRGFPHRARSLLAPALALPGVAAVVRALAGYAALLDDDPAVAVALLNGAIRADASLARAHFTLGLAQVRLGRQREALAAVRRALQLSPWYRPQVWCLDTGPDTPTVELPAERSEPVGSFHTDDVLLVLGRALLDASHLGEALALFDQVLTDQPASPAARFHRGVALAKLRRYREALSDLESVADERDSGELAAISRRHARSARQLAALFAEH
ncbi:MAG: tetratricopeptide repeat protein, partial [Gemmatimonadales bacterium]